MRNLTEADHYVETTSLSHQQALDLLFDLFYEKQNFRADIESAVAHGFKDGWTASRLEMQTIATDLLAAIPNQLPRHYQLQNSTSSFLQLLKKRGLKK